MNQTPEIPTYDFVVLGGGSAGYAAARCAASLGLRTAVVEGGREVGASSRSGGRGSSVCGRKTSASSARKSWPANAI